jgi:MFS family permease
VTRGMHRRRATFHEVFTVREFRPLFGSTLLSTLGDELARVALTVLVYQRTTSPLLSAITFAISYLPWLVGGPLLSTLADRFPRRRVLLTTDALRALVVAVMAVPGTPLPLLLVLLFVLACGAPPFESARSALTADLLDPERYAVANSMTTVGFHLAQGLGFVVGAALAAAANPSVVLLMGAATYAASALWLGTALQRRPAPAAEEGSATSFWEEATGGLRFILRSPRLRAIVAVTWVACLFVQAADGVAAPLAATLQVGSGAVGLLLAASPVGLMIGGLLLARFLPSERQQQSVPGLVLGSLAPVLVAGLVVVHAPPGPATLVAVLVLLFASGLGSAWSIALNVAFVQAVPSAIRGRAFGIAASGLIAVQGLGVLLAGVLAEWLSPGGAVAVIGALGLAAVVLPLLALVRTQAHVAADPATAGSSVP